MDKEYVVVVVQLLSYVPTLCDRMDFTMPGLESWASLVAQMERIAQL